MKKRVLASLLSLTMLLALLPTSALAAESTGVSELYVGDTALVSGGVVTEDAVENAVYDAETNTLTLNGVTISNGHTYADSANAGIYAVGS